MKYKTLPENPTTEMIEAAYPLVDSMPIHTAARQKRMVEAIYKIMWGLAPPPPATGLTRRQKQGQEFINQYIHEHKISPSLDEIAAGLKMRDKSQAHILVDALERKGVVKRTQKYQQRGIQLLIKPGQPLTKKRKPKR